MNDASPIPRRRLAELTQGWVPGAVRAPCQPAPFAVEAIEKENGLAKRAREVGDRSIDANYQIKGFNKRCCIGEIVQVRCEVV